MIEDWLLRPEIKPDKPTEPTAEKVKITVPGYGHFYVMKPVEGDIRDEFVRDVVKRLFGDYHYWHRGESQVTD